MKFIEVLKDGLTVERTVRRAGERVQVTAALKVLSKKAQVKRWGAPRYREISKADYEATGGEVIDPETEEPLATGAEAPDPASSALDRDQAAAVAAEADKFAPLEGLNVQETLEAVATLGDEGLAEFIAWERAGQNRVTLLEALDAGVE